MSLCGSRTEAETDDEIVREHAPSKVWWMWKATPPETNWKGVKAMASGVPCFLGGSGTLPSVRRIRLQKPPYLTAIVVYHRVLGHVLCVCVSAAERTATTRVYNQQNDSDTEVV